LFEVIKLKKDIGFEIRTDPETLLLTENAAKIRQLLVDNGVLVFNWLHISDEKQVELASHIGALRG
jgi:alpha-ketoglutarate-dependent taurine dioxygenase